MPSSLRKRLYMGSKFLLHPELKPAVVQVPPRLPPKDGASRIENAEVRVAFADLMPQAPENGGVQQDHAGQNRPQPGLNTPAFHKREPRFYIAQV